MANNNVRVTELDFDQIKANLKTFLRSQTEFTDYDFEASNLSVLIDLLAYNTHYNAVLANMVSNEMFLDTAIKRSSVVSLAKNIGYTPRSRKSARAKVSLSLSNLISNPNFLTLERYTPFLTSIDGQIYTFFNTRSYTTTPVNGSYVFDDIDLFQGRLLNFLYTVTETGPTAKYAIPNFNVDTDTIQVSVQGSGINAEIITYTPNSNITQLDSNSRVYFLQENTEGFYEIYFGDGVLGVPPALGDTITINYLITDGAEANVSNNVPVSWTTNTIAGESSNDRIITNISNPSGGSEPDEPDQIRFYAINNYETQNRAVTKNDYASIIQSNLPGAQSVNIWGGEENDPPVYGKTFISIKPRTGYVLTTAEKTRIIEEILEPRSMIAADHEFVDPTLTYVGFDVRIKYSSARTNLSAAAMQQLAYNKIVEFMDANLERFNATFYKSQLEEQIMNLDTSILSVNLDYRIQKRFPLIPNVRFGGIDKIKIPVRIVPNEVSSSYFYFTDDNGIHTSVLRDFPTTNPPDPNGTGIIKTMDLETGAVLDDNVATINYGTGVITLDASSPLTISGYVGGTTQLLLDFGPQQFNSGDNDVFPAFNEILTLDDSVAISAANVANGINIDIIAVNS